MWSLENYIRSSKRRDYKNDDNTNNLLINGFHIPDSFNINEEYSWATPLVSIIDKNGKAPLSLNRNYLLNGKLPFEKELLKLVAKKVIKAIFNVRFDKIGNLFIPQKKSTILNLEHREDFSNQIIIYDDYYTIDHQFIHHERGTSKTYSIWKEANNKEIDTRIDFQGYSIQKALNNTNKAYSNTIDSEYYRNDSLDQWFTFGGNNAKANTWIRIYMKKDRYLHLFDNDKKRIRTSFKNRIKLEKQSENWVCFSRLCDSDYGEKAFPKENYTLDDPNIKLEDLEKETNNIDLIIERKFGYLRERYGQYYYNQNKREVPEYKKYSRFRTFEKLIEEYLPKDLLIPIDIKKRKKLLEKIILELEINLD